MLDSGMKIKQPWCCVLWSCRKGCSKLLQLQGKNWVSQAPGKDSGHLQYCTSLRQLQAAGSPGNRPSQAHLLSSVLLSVSSEFKDSLCQRLSLPHHLQYPSQQRDFDQLTVLSNSGGLPSTQCCPYPPPPTSGDGQRYWQRPRQKNLVWTAHGAAALPWQ